MSFSDEFGDTGAPARTYWDIRIGHVLPGITPENVGWLKPTDLLGAVALFETKFEAE